MGRYVVEVTVSDHEHLRHGIVERPRCPGAPTYHRIIVAADTDGEALLIASQMACATGDMCTSAVLVDFPT